MMISTKQVLCLTFYNLILAKLYMMLKILNLCDQIELISYLSSQKANRKRKNKTVLKLRY